MKEPAVAGHAPERIELFSDEELRRLQRVIAGIAVGLGYDNTEYGDMLWEDDLDHVRVVLKALGAGMKIHAASEVQPQVTWEEGLQLEPPETGYNRWTTKELRDELRFRGLMVSGNKKDLIARLEVDDLERHCA
jgi:hypothetical protein